MRISSVFIYCIFNLVTFAVGAEKLTYNLPTRREGNAQWKQLFRKFINKYGSNCSIEDTLGFLNERKNGTFQDLNNDIPYFSPCNLSERDEFNLYTILNFEDENGNPKEITIKACKELPNENLAGIKIASKIAKCKRFIKNQCVLKFHENVIALPGTKLNYQYENGQKEAITCDVDRWTYPEKHIPSIDPRSNFNSIDCGKKYKQVTMPYLNNGRNAESGEFPWHAGVYRNGDIVCGATIIRDDTLLSAAHCFSTEMLSVIAVMEPVSEYTIMVGKVLSNMSEIEDNATQKFAVKKIITPSYRGFTLFRGQNDIAMVKIIGKIIFGEKVTPICLFNRSSNVIHNKAWVETAGWGANGNKSITEVLQTATLPYFSYEGCYDEFPIGIDAENAQTTISSLLTTDKCCVGNISKTIDNGDSGGGLVMRQDDRYYLVGIISVLPTDFIPRIDKYKSTRTLSLSTYVPWFREWIDVNLQN